MKHLLSVEHQQQQQHVLHKFDWRVKVGIGIYELTAAQNLGSQSL